MKILKIIYPVLLILLFSGQSFGDTWYVDAVNGDDSWPGILGKPKKTIMAAVAIAGDYDTILAADGTYSGSNNRNINFGGKIIYLRSENGPDNSIIDAENLDRVFNLLHEDANSSITGFKITGGYCDNSLGGGAIFLNSSDVTIQDCIITDNVADYRGGAIVALASAVKFRNCNIERNSAGKTGITANGGAMYLGNCTALEISDCNITSNYSYSYGGGLYIEHGTLSINNSLIADNLASQTGFACHGGGIYATNVTRMDLLNCNIRNNSCLTHGGGLYNFLSNVSLKNCLLEANIADGSGGALFNYECIVDANNCTFVANSAASNGGAAILTTGYTWQMIMTAKNCIFYSNSAGSVGNDVRLAMYTRLNYSYCDIDPGGIASLGDANDLGGNFYLDPLFAMLGYDDVGTWVAGDYHLKSKAGRFDPNTKSWILDSYDSPCIDAGDPCDSPGLEPAYNGDKINLGCYGGTIEASKSPYCDTSILKADLNGDCVVDFADLALFASEWMDCSREPQNACP